MLTYGQGWGESTSGVCSLRGQAVQEGLQRPQVDDVRRQVGQQVAPVRRQRDARDGRVLVHRDLCAHALASARRPMP